MTTDRTSLEQLDHTLTRALSISILVAASVFSLLVVFVLGWQVWENKDAWGGVALFALAIFGIAGGGYGWMCLADRFVLVRIVSKIFWTIVAVAGLGYLIAGMIEWLLLYL